MTMSTYKDNWKIADFKLFSLQINPKPFENYEIEDQEASENSFLCAATKNCYAESVFPIAVRVVTIIGACRNLIEKLPIEIKIADQQNSVALSSPSLQIQAHISISL
ncbi:CLUMA_CG015928, isoform A [Clunio marinus]|uniref:CLUMA_CG015928, isoform A n=1 Tax=Clunio marinus TaxID=568069 RepID=A0A1J1IUZ0_9DIPT|nr:CLUMA_CG015928, isoform A [Clunio marinus]